MLRSLRTKPVIILINIALWTIVWVCLSGIKTERRTDKAEGSRKQTTSVERNSLILPPPVSKDEVFDDPQWRGESFG